MKEIKFFHDPNNKQRLLLAENNKPRIYGVVAYRKAQNSDREALVVLKFLCKILHTIEKFCNPPNVRHRSRSISKADNAEWDRNRLLYIEH